MFDCCVLKELFNILNEAIYQNQNDMTKIISF